jgi:hypothetical protein
MPVFKRHFAVMWLPAYLALINYFLPTAYNVTTGSQQSAYLYSAEAIANWLMNSGQWGTTYGGGLYVALPYGLLHYRWNYNLNWLNNFGGILKQGINNGCLPVLRYGFPATIFCKIDLSSVIRIYLAMAPIREDF